MARNTLSADDLAAIRALEDLCNQADATNLKLNWDLMQMRSPEVVSDFCAYDDDALIGCHRRRWGQLELTGAVAPRPSPPRASPAP
ncbi:MAG: hypothetical protein U0841_15360 [Chloroflexia bacterium]